MEYETALDRAYDALPEQPTAAESRLSIPDPEGETDGAFTRLTNLPSIASALGREPEHVHRSIQKTLGTNGQFDGGQARYNGSFSVADLEGALDEYVAEYVSCSECGLPDTVLVTENGIDMLRCQACGAFRPVEKRPAGSRQPNRAAIEEGQSYELSITGTGRKGDGVAEKGNFTIFVPGASEGETVRVRIENVDGTLAFAERI
ncbi:MAG: translation initiation factor IF-2 subunit beta [Salinirussus sp.]